MGGEVWFGVIDGGHHFGFRFTDADTADGVAVPFHGGEGFGGAFAELGVDATLDDAEVELATGIAAGLGLVFFDPVAAAEGPAEGEVEAFGGVGFGDWPWRAVVEEHGDVGAEDGLDFHAFFGADEAFGAVEVALEVDSGLSDFAEFGEREDLEAAAVGEEWAVPCGEGVEAAEVAEDVAAWSEVEVVGVAEDDLGTEGFEFVRGDGFDGALGADGHEDRGFHHPVRQLEPPAPGAAVRVGLEESEHEGS